MLGSDSSKRQRTDDSQPPTAATTSSSASPLSGSAKSDHPSADTKPRLRTRDLIRQMLETQTRLSADVARLQSTVEAVLSTLHQSKEASDKRQSSIRHINRPTPLRSTGHTRSSSGDANAVPPTLANIVSPRSLVQPNSVPLSDSELDTKPRMDAEDVSDTMPLAHTLENTRTQSPQPHRLGQQHVFPHEYHHQPRARNQSSHFYSTPPPPQHSASMQSASSSMSMSSAISNNLTLPGPMSQTPSSVMPASRLRSPPPQSLHQMSSRHFQTQQQQQSAALPPPPSTPLSAPPSSSSIHPSTRFPPHGHFQQQQQNLSHSQMPHKAPLRLPHHSSHNHPQFGGLPASASSHRSHGHPNAEQTISLPPIRTATFQHSIHHRGSVPPKLPSTGPSTFSPSSALSSGMILDATPKTAKPSPPPPPSQQHTQHHHQYHSQQAFMPGYAYARPPLSATDISTPTSAMIESPTVSSSGFTGSRGQSLLPPPPHSYSGSLPSTSVAGGSGKVILNDGAQQKVEKNRFQANIRSFVDQHFTVPQNPQWDYHQSFKAPRNALATQNIIQAFHADHGSPYDRIEHGLSVYFSSLKAKFRTTEDKAMLKQQRDRRRARRIKKAAGRRKVFDQTQFPFLPKEFETHLCFIPSAMSPEHTDNDGEVKVGMLPWRAVKFTRLFKHLDTLRPKRTPRPNNPELIGARAPPPDVPLFMIDPEFVALDRAQQEHHDPEEEDIEMDSMSDGD